MGCYFYYISNISLTLTFASYKSKKSLAADIEQRAFFAGESSFPELEVVFKRLHHFRRGTILGTNIQSSDDRCLLRDLFLRLPLRDCLVMMAPDLWMYYFDGNGDIVSAKAPAETLVMLDDNVSTQR